MRTARNSLLLLLALLVAAASGGESFLVDPAHWALAFDNDTPKPLVIDDPTGPLVYYWYMVYRVKNPSDRPLPCRLDLSLELQIQKATTAYPDVHDPVAERQLETKIVQKPLLNCVELRAKPLAKGESREAVAIFRIGTKQPDFDRMTIYVRGLAARRHLGRAADGDTRQFRDRVLNLRYLYAVSRWKTGKELKVDGEAWTLEQVKVSDRAEATTEHSEALSKRLQELRKKAEDLRKKVPSTDGSKTPPRSSRGRSAAGLASAGPAVGRPAPKLLKALRTVADRWRSGRATFTETVGRDASRQTATGTIYLGKQRKFAIERILKLAAAQAIQELRVFDGRTLWAQTTTKEFGHSVRRCDRDAARKQWRAVDGRPEVDFATVANPVQAWRLFGDDLVHLGIERLADEGAYVFEIRPDKKLQPVLTGPLSSEVLYKAAGRRVRFWIGAKSGFQLRMRVYDDGGNVLASLECADVELDAHISPDLFAYKIPPGVKVTDVNAAVADGDSPPAPAAP